MGVTFWNCFPPAGGHLFAAFWCLAKFPVAAKQHFSSYSLLRLILASADAVEESSRGLLHDQVDLIRIF